MKRYVVELANDIAKEAESQKMIDQIISFRNAYIMHMITEFDAIMELSRIWFEIRNGGEENE